MQNNSLQQQKNGFKTVSFCVPKQMNNKLKACSYSYIVVKLHGAVSLHGSVILL